MNTDAADCPLVVEVRDDGDGPRPEQVGRPGDTLAERGRGLSMVDCLARSWGVRHLPGGSSVWAVLGAA